VIYFSAKYKGIPFLPAKNLAAPLAPKNLAGPASIPGAKPDKCPTLLNTASHSLSGGSIVLRVVKPSMKPPAACLTASRIEKSPS